jgi:hypothetical protein
VSADQLLVLVLLAAAFAAGWVARGGKDKDEESGGPAGRAPEPPAAPPADDALVAEADLALGRAITAGHAARAVAAAPAGTSEAASRAALSVLDQRLAELEDVADRLENALGPDAPAFLAFDRIASGMATLRRRVDGDGVLTNVESARADWELAVRP